jgi:predicted hotdog family 3-hydroxylacyl-ACP dehydratase
MLAPIESLVPHRAPMRWIDALIECTPSTATATACFAESHFAVSGGTVLESALIECVAQTVAAAQGYRAQLHGGSQSPSNGMLVAVSDFLVQYSPPAGQELRIEIREIRRLGSLLRVFGAVTCAGQLVATGELSFHV